MTDVAGIAVPVLELADIIAEVMRRPAVNGLRLIGIDGPSGSGKSTLARRLAGLAPAGLAPTGLAPAGLAPTGLAPTGLAPAAIIEIDDFNSWTDLGGWWPRFELQVLEPLLAGRAAHFQLRDWENDEFGCTLGGWKTVPWAPLVIIEGVTSTRRAVSDRLSYAIWADAPRELRLRRGLARDGETHRDVWMQWMRDETEFFRIDGARARADLCIDTAPRVPHDPQTQVVRV